ncbi:restriction endonuclease subunit S [Agrobacterium deltaense]|uniref:restriction endonuclease subunit S n=1 Tax=Agrobacterium deltaense TaxID=1183412 RepID=UPI0009BA7AA4|nr:restriction endonuclease subunit S [Agrobacterium deltaense]CUX10148.1 Restriction modification system specificity subunit [Agrobacterium deltaense RV3]
MSSKVKSSAATGGVSALVPTLRFPEFQGSPAWEPVSLRRASVPVAERVGERKLTPVSISAGIGFVPQAEKFGRDISGNQYQLYTLVRDGDFVFNKGNSLKFPQGCIYLLQGWGQVAAPNVFIAFRLKDGYLNGFFRNCFEQNQHGKQLKKHITSGARSNGLLNISKETFFNVEIPAPSLPEQRKIADCLDSVDALIAAQGRKVEALRAHKKGLMQQLFPQEGESQPRLRFPEFRDAGDWVKAKLGNHVAIGSGGSPSNFTLSSAGKYAFVKVEDLNNCTKYQITGREFCNDSAGTIPTNSIVFPKRGAAIELNKIRITAAEILIDTNLMALTPKNGLATEFLYYSIANVGLSHIADTSTIPQINNKHIIPFDFLLPTRPEQQRIADSLSSLDDLIAAEIQKLDRLMTHKKGLMQQLFPQLGEADA